MTPRSVLSAGIALALMTACGEVVSGVEEDAGSVTQFETVLYGQPAYTQWFLLVVDDAPTEAARSLREHLADDLHGFFDDLDGADCGVRADPALYRPIDLRLIVVGASGTLEPRFQDSDGLYAFGVDASPELLATFEEAGRQAILGMETSEVLPFVGVFELVHYLNLIQSEAEPRSSAEAELVRVLPAPSSVWPFAGLAKTRADVSPEGPAPSLLTTILDVRMLDWPEDGTCPLHERYDVVPGLFPLGVTWSSPDCFEEARIFDVDWVGDCWSICMPRLPATDASGRAACRVYGEFPADVDCEESSGWTFLETAESQSFFEDAPPVNLCELRQAEGDALAACIDDFACEGCEPSFCFRRPFTEEDDLDPAHLRPAAAADSVYCELFGNTDAPWDRIRIVHGADQVGGLIRVVCQE